METDETIGTTVGSYKITAKLGQGGMGAVYLAEHTLLERKAAVKILLPELSSHRDSVDRFFHEARTTARLRHPAMVDVYDFGTLPDGRAYLIMDFLEGESLEARLRTRGALPVAEALRIARDIALGVSVAHAEQIVHRDLKPDNLFLLPPLPGSHEERVKILDFGIAKLGRKSGELGAGVTRAGALLGTPQFMSPEQCRGGGEVDARADVYALGCILFAMLAGRPPFVSESMGELLGAHLLTPPPTLASLDVTVSPALEALIESMLAKYPDERPASMVLVADQLDRLLRQAGTELRRSARTLNLGSGENVPTRRGRPTPGAPAAGAATLAGETLRGQTISENGQRGLPGRARGALVVAGAALVVAIVGVGLVVSGARSRQAPAAGGPAVERAPAPAAPASAAPAAPAELPGARPPAPLLEAAVPPAAAPVVTTPAVPSEPRPARAAVRTRKGEARRARGSVAEGGQTPAPPASSSPGPASPERAVDKHGRPIYRGTQLQIEKNDPY